MSVEATGESYTHAAWRQQVGVVMDHLGALHAAADTMLASLTAQDGGDAHIAGVQAWIAAIEACEAHGERLVSGTDQAQRPVGEAIGAAGGVSEVTGDKHYYAETR
jgi:hypothetical protein